MSNTTETIIKHGTERGTRRQETTYGEGRTFTNATTGEVVYSGPISSHTQTVSERYCAWCADWKQAKGIIGGMLCQDCGHDWHDAPAVTPTAAQIAQARQVLQAWDALEALPYNRNQAPERAARRVYREAGGVLFEMCGGNHALIDAALAAAR